MGEGAIGDDVLAHAHAHALVEELVGAGVEQVALSPGTTGAALAIALATDERIRLHVVLDERSAAYLALGAARASGRPAVAVSTSGTAPANFLPAILEARQSGLPLVVITADRPPELREVGATPSVDQVKMFGDAVVRFLDLPAPSAQAASVPAWRAAVCRAVADAVGPPGGPVQVNVSFRGGVTPRLWDPPPPRARRPGLAGAWTHVPPVRPTLPEPDLIRLAGAVESASHGIVVVGGGAEVDAAPVLAFAQTVGWPVFAEPSSGLRQGAESIGSYEALLRSRFAAARRPDFVLRVGTTGLTPTVAAYAGTAPQLLVDPSGQWPDPARAASWLVRADPADLFMRLATVVSPGRTAWLEEWQEAEALAQGAIDATLRAEPALTEPGVARTLASSVPDGSIVFVGPSMPMRDCDWFMRPRRGVRVLGNRGVNGIDGFVSSAVGASVATGARVFGLAGDLTLAHDQNGLLAAADSDADIVFVVVNNRGGGIFSFLPHGPGLASFERLFAADQHLDFGRIAAVYGCGHARATTAAELADAVGQQRRGVRIVEVGSDRADNVDVHDRLWAAVDDAIRPLVRSDAAATVAMPVRRIGAVVSGVGSSIGMHTTIERLVPQETNRGTP